MSLTTITVDNTWGSSPAYTAAADIDVAVTNPSVVPLTLSVTINGTPSSEDTKYGLTVDAFGDRGLQLKSGDRLWVSAPTLADGASITAGLQD